MVPPPSFVHDRITYKLMFALEPFAARLGLITHGPSTGMFGSEKDYRIPDITIARNDHSSDRGFEGAEVVVEVLSPNDESREKFGFYATRGIRESWLVDPRTRAVEMYELQNGAYVRMAELRSPVLGIALEVGDKLRVIEATGSSRSSRTVGRPKTPARRSSTPTR